MRRFAPVVMLAVAALPIVFALSGTAYAKPPFPVPPHPHAPEIDPGLAATGLAVLAGGVMLLLERFRKRG